MPRKPGAHRAGAPCYDSQRSSIHVAHFFADDNWRLSSDPFAQHPGAAL
jgi:hypothetical protein